MSTVDWLLENLVKAKIFDKGANSGSYVSACCPAHPDARPSFFLYLSDNRGFCKSCGFKTDLPGLIQKVTGKTLAESRKEARQLVRGGDSRPVRRSDSNSPRPGSRSLGHYATDQGIDYWESRHVSEISRLRYRLGYDEAKGAVVIPVHTPKGEPAGLVYRYTDKNSFKRYENSPGMEPSKLLWGYHYLKRPRRVYVTEGPLDAILLNQNGYPAVATLTSSISKYQIKLLNKTGAEICVVLDSDKAGLQLGDRISNIGYTICCIVKDGIKDSAEMVAKLGTIELEHIPARCWRSWVRQSKNAHSNR